MTYFEDLTPYSYDDYYPVTFKGRTIKTINVGWLDGEHPFPTGEVPKQLIERLIENSKYRFVLHRGHHECNLDNCDNDYDEYYFGNGQIVIRSKSEVWYSAPTMIVHYILSQKYKPPDQFINSVINCKDDNTTLINNKHFDCWEKRQYKQGLM